MYFFTLARRRNVEAVTTVTTRCCKDEFCGVVMKNSQESVSLARVVK